MEKKGLKKGLKEGLNKGRKEKEEDIIKRCLEQNMSIERISKIVNLPIESVNETIKKIKGDQK